MNRPLFALVALTMLAACQQKEETSAPAAEVRVTDAVVRLAPVDGRPSAAYFTIHGGKTPDRLEAVTSPKTATIDLHESKMEGGVMSMSPLTGVDVPAAGEAVFKPGGNHAMLFGMDPTVKAGGTVPLTFTFQSGKKIEVEAKAIAAGDEMPAMGHGEHQ